MQLIYFITDRREILHDSRSRTGILPFGDAVPPRHPQNTKFWPSKYRYLENGKSRAQRYMSITVLLELKISSTGAF